MSTSQLVHVGERGDLTRPRESTAQTKAPPLSDCSTSGAPYSAKRRVNTRTALSAVGLATSSASTRLPWKSTTPTTHTGTDKRVADEAALLSLVLVEVHRSAAARRRAEVSVAVGRW